MWSIYLRSVMVPRHKVMGGVYTAVNDMLICNV